MAMRCRPRWTKAGVGLQRLGMHDQTTSQPLLTQVAATVVDGAQLRK
jgi:hypothetical protein